MYICNKNREKEQIDMTLKEEVYRLHANVCSGIADPKRILILYKLAEYPTNVSELAEALETPQPTVSRHLKILRDCGLVAATRDGKAMIYSLIDRRIIKALDLLRAVLAESLESKSELAKTATKAMNTDI
jgi:ArsR family transcriptional regulator